MPGCSGVVRLGLRQPIADPVDRGAPGRSCRGEARREHDPWNKGRLIGQKRPLKPKDVWTIRVRLQLERRRRDLAIFNLAIDSKLRGCDLIRLKIDDVCAGGRLRDRATVIQKGTSKQARDGNSPSRVPSARLGAIRMPTSTTRPYRCAQSRLERRDSCCRAAKAPRSLSFADGRTRESRVRNGLSAGGKGIRTAGPP